MVSIEMARAAFKIGARTTSPSLSNDEPAAQVQQAVEPPPA